jgi:membrane fusion protein (multidrug efflux system)
MWGKIHAPAQAQMPQGRGNMEVEVSVVKITKEKIQLFKELPGRVSAYRIADVKPQVDGIIRKRLFTEGQLVNEGDQLYEIDQTIYKISLASSQVNYAAAKANYDRMKFLVKEEAVSKKEFEDARTEFARAEAELKNAKTILAYTQVLAPISGYISKSNVTEGNLVSVNQAQALATITQLNPIYVDIVQPSKNFAQFKGKKEVAVSLEIDNEKFEETGILKFSEVFANQSTDSIKLRAEFPNPNEKLLPGMFVTALLHLEPLDGITVLQRATTRMPDGSLAVFVVDQNNIVHARIIKTKGISGDSWIVEEGLNEGDLVILEGYQKVGEGAKVKTLLKSDGDKK